MINLSQLSGPPRYILMRYNLRIVFFFRDRVKLFSYNFFCISFTYGATALNILVCIFRIRSVQLSTKLSLLNSPWALHWLYKCLNCLQFFFYERHIKYTQKPKPYPKKNICRYMNASRHLKWTKVIFIVNICTYFKQCLTISFVKKCWSDSRPCDDYINITRGLRNDLLN